MPIRARALPDDNNYDDDVCNETPNNINTTKRKKKSTLFHLDDGPVDDDLRRLGVVLKAVDVVHRDEEVVTRGQQEALGRLGVVDIALHLERFRLVCRVRGGRPRGGV